LRAFVAHSPVDKPEKKNSVRLGIKKLTHASNSPSDDQPTAEVSKSYLMGSSTLHVEATLDKRMYCHGEDIKVNLTIHNRTGRTVRKIKISGIKPVTIHMDCIIHFNVLVFSTTVC
jgi:beta-arrestin